MHITKIKRQEEFNKVDYTEISNQLKNRHTSAWQKDGEENALEIFHQAAKRVPAYKKFLQQHKINPDNIKTISDYKKVPTTDKQNYMDKFSLKDRSWDGKLTNNFIINTSSGTTGVPYFWPGMMDQVIEDGIITEIVFNESFEISQHKTLLVICFGMGTWIAGSHTFTTAQAVALKGYPLTIITPGFNKEETLRILKLLASEFDQTIIAGIPTFVKDLLEDWVKNPDSKKINKLRFLFAGEGFSESWRDYLLSLTGSSNNLTDVVSILGSADAAIMGFETPLSVALRKVLDQDVNLRLQLFNNERTPAIMNYIPAFRFFEVVGGELVLTANQGIPLIRYNIHDQGGLLSFDDLEGLLAEMGVVISNDLFHKLPFVYLFGRGKFTATLYGVNVYPENVREVLSEKEIQPLLSGRFILETKYDKSQQQYLQLNLELAEGVNVSSKLSKQISDVFFKKVRILNSEYKKMSEEYGDKAKPEVVLYLNGESDLFPKNQIKKSS